MSSLGVFKDLQASDSLNVGGTINLNNPTALSPQNPTIAGAGWISVSTVDSITAGGGTGATTQAGGTPILSMANRITLGGANYSVTLPKPNTNNVGDGQLILIFNTTGTAVNVYPAVGDQINALGANAAYSMATVTAAIFICTSISSTGVAQWQTLKSTF